jgi:hypothetical protein
MNIFSFIVVAITIDPANKTAADSLLPIIQSQRERYRIRAQELEAVSLIRPIIHMYSIWWSPGGGHTRRVPPLKLEKI